MNPIIDWLPPNANAAATGATNAALDAASARPYNVVLSIAPDTQKFLIVLLIAAAIRAALVK